MQTLKKCLKRFSSILITQSISGELEDYESKSKNCIYAILNDLGSNLWDSYSYNRYSYKFIYKGVRAPGS